MRTILIAGGTGFVGKYVCRHLQQNGYRLNILTRRAMPDSEGMRYFQWDVENGVIDPRAWENVTAIINLTGANIGAKRWSAQRKTIITNSRVDALNLLFDSVQKHQVALELLISASATGYYGAVTSPIIFTEDAAPRKDFLASVCVQWEKTAHRFEELGARVVILRQGVVVGKEDALYAKLAPLAKLGINPAAGSGEQYIPWIDICDLVNLYKFCMENDVRGVFNAVASQHATMNDVAKELLASCHKSTFIPNAPSFAVKVLFGEMATMILNGSRVSNDKITKAGFTFMHDSLGATFKRLASAEKTNFCT